MKPILQTLKQRVLIYDGAMGTMLQARGVLKKGMCPDALNLTNPDVIRKVHEEYVSAGADVIETNSFGANRLKLREFGLEDKLEEINIRAVELAKKAARKKAYVAYGFGPLGKMLEPLGNISFDEAVDIFRQMISTAVKAGPDLILIETMTDMKEAKAAVVAAREVTNLPIEVHLAYGDGCQTVTGTSPQAALVTFNALDVQIIGSNCGFGLEEHERVLKEERCLTGRFIAVLPNAGLPKLVDGKTVFLEPPESFHVYAERYRELGANLIGGCCGTTPDHIREIARAIKGKPPKAREVVRCFSLSSRSRAVLLDDSNPFFLIGERINPTARKVLSAELKEGKMVTVRRDAMEQARLGASALDINVGVPNIDQPAMMREVVRAAQNVVDCPIVLDSSEPAVLEAGLKQVCGKALINSVSGKSSSMDKILPLARKYGAAVLGLTLDEKGIPKKASERVEVARRIMTRALECGIAKEDIVIDPLTLTLSAERDGAYETLRAIEIITKELDLAASLGVSNISYGLPNRSLINARFLELARQFGLSVGIINPKDENVMSVVRKRVSFSPDKNKVASFLKSADDIVKKKIVEAKQEILSKQEEELILKKGVETKLYEAILYGERELIGPLVEQALKKYKPLDINSKFLVPALEEVGNRFEKREFFLPQILLSAETMQRAFQILKVAIDKEGEHGEKGRVIMATVEGDVHDIGKNIVTTVLENYGYAVFDVGINVPAERIIKEAVEKEAQIIGLSSLMTTTMKEMEKVINILRDRQLPFKTLVGGAVVDKDFAERIGASGYAKDAIEAVRVVKKLLG